MAEVKVDSINGRACRPHFPSSDHPDHLSPRPLCFAISSSGQTLECRLLSAGGIWYCSAAWYYCCYSTFSHEHLSGLGDFTCVSISIPRLCVSTKS